jgi:YHS domain-containing protein
MKPREILILASFAASFLFVDREIRAQESVYRLTPPLRLAARPAEQSKATSVDEPDPYRPRDPRRMPTTVSARGFCLVTLRDHGQWLLGSQEIQATRGDKVYWFSGVRARDIFVAAPELYLPALDGDCLVTFAQTGERQSGELQWGLIYKRRIYFFANQERLKEFEADPQSYADADLVDRGRCVVSKVEENLTVPGLPETVAIVDGRRYFFASAFHRNLFESRPKLYLGSEPPGGEVNSVTSVPSAKVAASTSIAFGAAASQLPSESSPVDLIPKKVKKDKNSKKAKERDDGEQIENRAMSGYCPVTIRTQGLWQRGKSKFKSTFDGGVYYMVGPEELSAFQANPREFMAVLGGDSVVSLVNDYERVAGSVFNAVQYKGRLFLFTDAQQKKVFGEQPALFENADLANGGNCLISQLEDKKEIQGSVVFEAIYRGLRYRFVSEKYMKKFLGDPKVFVEQ